MKILGPGEGRRVEFRGATILRKADGSDTRGSWAVGEAAQPAGFENSPHSHTEPEGFYVLAGHFTLFGPDGQSRLTPGSFVLIEPGEVHGFRAGEDGGRFLAIWPAKMDGYFEAMISQARAGSASPQAMAEIGRRHGVTGHGVLPDAQGS
jgi:quercetin dioxygenase-like cupin family protein